MPGIDGPGVLSALPDLSPRWRRTVGPAQPRGGVADVPHGSRALRPTARQRRESGAKGRALSGSFRTGNRAPDSVFPEAIRTGSGLWHSGGAPPARRFPGWGPPPNHPLVRSMSHRIAMPRQHAPAHRGTDPPGVSQTNNGKSPPAPGGVWGRHNFNPERVIFLSLGQGELNEPPP